MDKPFFVKALFYTPWALKRLVMLDMADQLGLDRYLVYEQPKRWDSEISYYGYSNPNLAEYREGIVWGESAPAVLALLDSYGTLALEPIIKEPNETLANHLLMERLGQPKLFNFQICEV